MSPSPLLLLGFHLPTLFLFFFPQVTLSVMNFCFPARRCLYITAPATLHSTSSATKAYTILQTETILHPCLFALPHSPILISQPKAYEIQLTHSYLLQYGSQSMLIKLHNFWRWYGHTIIFLYHKDLKQQ